MEPTIAIPEEAVEAVTHAALKLKYPFAATEADIERVRKDVKVVLDEFAKWQAAHPPQFRDEQIDNMNRQILTARSNLRDFLAEAFRSAYTAEPELPEAVKEIMIDLGYDETLETAEKSRTYKLAVNSYRAGLEEGSKK